MLRTMSKRNITYVKPQDPKFLKQLKEQIGFKEGPSVETKRQKLEDLEDFHNEGDRPELEDEKPQIVVLKSGDLTAEEVATEQRRLAREAAEESADLNKPIIFRKCQKPTSDITLDKKVEKNKSNKKRFVEHKLSFNVEEEEE